MAIARYYLNDPNAPKPNSPTRVGTNVFLEWEDKLLLEKRWDCEEWGLLGGRLKNGESYVQGIARELREESGILLPHDAFTQLCVVDDDRIASYRDGTVWRMVIVLFRARLDKSPTLRPSRESGELRFFSKSELSKIKIVKTHSDLVARWMQESC